MSKNIKDLPQNTEGIDYASDAAEMYNESTGKNEYALFSKFALPAGSIIPFAGTSAPSGFLSADGVAVSRTTYAELFAAIGTTWGVGDGSTTFNKPDLRAMFLRGAGAHGTLNMADGNDFDGGSVGDEENDKFQGHYHNFNNTLVATGTAGATRNVFGNSTDSSGEVLEAETDGINGTPRPGDETKPVHATVLYIIKT